MAKGLRRNRNVEKILNQDLKFVSRKRNDKSMAL